MDKKSIQGLFANDGSFMERFKKLQEEQAKANSGSSIAVQKTVVSNKRPSEVGRSEPKKDGALSSSGKLAFSLKKPKVPMATVKFSVDEEEDEQGIKPDSAGKEEPVKRFKVVQADVHDVLVQLGNVVPSPPSDMTVRKVIDKLAYFVAKNGRHLEHTTRQRNPGDTPFKFLFDKNCSDYKYYEYKLLEEEKALQQSKESQTSQNANSSSSPSGALGIPQKGSALQKSNYQTPASALYGTFEEAVSSRNASNSTESSSSSDPVALMDFYMKKAAQEERKRPYRQSKDEMPPPPSLQGPVKKGHHMGDFIPPDELEKFLASCNDASTQKAYKEAAENAKIQADNIGHRLLSKMGWREGEGLGSEGSGRAEPVMAGDVKKDNLGVGASKPGEVSADDDIYEQYKKRMMLGYRYRPNPLNNPRKQYY